LAGVAAALAIYGAVGTAQIAAGYAANMKVAQLNRNAAQAWDAQSWAVVTQYYMIDDNYGWSWPYASAFHVPYYEMYLGLPVTDPSKPLPIDWEKYPPEG